jgi:hypothetical protein
MVMGGLPEDKAISIYDIADPLGVDSWFAAIPAMKGIYLPEWRRISGSALRPSVRQVFTCTHDLGHEVHEHGEQVDGTFELRTAGGPISTGRVCC